MSDMAFKVVVTLDGVEVVNAQESVRFKRPSVGRVLTALAEKVFALAEDIELASFTRNDPIRPVVARVIKESSLETSKS